MGKVSAQNKMISGVSVGPVLFSQMRSEIIGIIGRPSVYINELFMPGILIDRFRESGLEVYYDFRSNLFPIAIEFTRRFCRVCDGIDIFALPFAGLAETARKIWGSEIVEGGPGQVYLTPPDLVLNYQGENLNEKSRLFSVTTYRPGMAKLIEQRMAGPRPTEAPSAEERDMLYGHFYKFELS